MFVELDRGKNAGHTVSLEWDRDTGETQIVLSDSRDASVRVCLVQGVNAADAFRHRSGTGRSTLDSSTNLAVAAAPCGGQIKAPTRRATQAKRC